MQVQLYKMTLYHVGCRTREVPMSYRLKKEENAFRVCREGKFEYHRFEHGKTYDEVPPEDAHRFETTDAEIQKSEDAGTRRRGEKKSA